MGLGLCQNEMANLVKGYSKQKKSKLEPILFFALLYVHLTVCNT